MIDINPANVDVDNPVRGRKEQHPFESWKELEQLVKCSGRGTADLVRGRNPATACGVDRPREADVDRKERGVYVAKQRSPLTDSNR